MDSNSLVPTTNLPPNLDDDSEFDVPNQLWGYDYFISYHWASGGAYAVALAQRLRDRGFDCFLDRAEFAMGEDWKQQGDRALRNTQVLILIATREAVTQSPPVQREVEIFTARSNRIIPIQFGDTIADLDRQQSAVLKHIAESLLYIPEQQANLSRGPSESVIDQIVNTHQILRRRTLRQRVVAAVITVLAIAAIVMAVLGAMANSARKQAVKSLAKEQAANRLANKRLGDINYNLARTAWEKDNDRLRSVNYLFRAAEAYHGGEHSSLFYTTHWAAVERQDNLWTFTATKKIHGIKLLDDEKQLLTWGSDGLARILDINTGRQLREFPHEETCSGDPSLRPPLLLADGRILTWNASGTAWISSRDTDEVLTLPHEKLRGHSQPVSILGASSIPKTRYVLTWCGDGTARLWDSKTGEETQRLVHESSMSSENAFPINGAVSFDKDSKILTWSDDGTARIWDIKTGAELARCEHGGLDQFKKPFKIRGAVLRHGESHLLTWSNDGFVRAWLTQTGTCVKSFHHLGDIYGLLLFSDDTRFATWSTRLVIWDFDSGLKSRELQHGGNITSVELMPGGRVLTGCSDGFARIWSIDRAVEEAKYEHPGQWKPRGQFGMSQSHWVCASPLSDGTRLLTRSSDGAARIWDVVQGTMLHAVQHQRDVNGDTIPCWGARALSRGRLLTWGHDDLRMWQTDFDEGLILRHEGERDNNTQFSLNGACLLADRKKVLTWATDGNARLWNIPGQDETGVRKVICYKHKTEHDGDPCAIDGAELFAKDSKLLTWSTDGTARIWDVTDSKKAERIFSHNRPRSDKGPFRVRGATLFAAESRILTWSDDGTARIWDATHESGEKVFPHGTVDTDGKPYPVNGAKLFRRHTQLLTWSDDGTVRIWIVEAESKPTVLTHNPHDDGRTEPNAVLGVLPFANETRLLAWGKGGATIWTLDASIEPKVFPVERCKIKGARLCLDGAGLLTWGDDGVVRLWDITGRSKETAFHHSGEDSEGKAYGVEGAELFSQDSRVLTWASDGTVRIWDVETGSELRKFLHEGYTVFGATLFCGNSRLLTWSGDWTSRIWDAENGIELRRFPHDRAVLGARLFSAESFLLTWSADGTARLFDLTVDYSVPIDERILDLEIRTATEMDERGEIRRLTAEEQDGKRQELEKLRSSRRSRQ